MSKLKDSAKAELRRLVTVRSNFFRKQDKLNNNKPKKLEKELPSKCKGKREKSKTRVSINENRTITINQNRTIHKTKTLQ